MSDALFEPTSPQQATRAEGCAERGHPGDTYNPWFDRTWCHCGHLITDGDNVVLPKWWKR